MLTATSTTLEVTTSLDASQQSEVKVGDPATVTLSNNTTTPGVVSSVGTVASAPSCARPTRLGRGDRGAQQRHNHDRTASSSGSSRSVASTDTKYRSSRRPSRSLAHPQKDFPFGGAGG